MRLGIIILLSLLLVWILSLSFAEKIGSVFIKIIIDPIKDLFK